MKQLSLLYYSILNSRLLNAAVHHYMLSHFSHVRPFVGPWTVAHQAPLTMRFSRQEYWSGLLCPPSGISPTQQTQISKVFCIGRRALYH